MSDLFSLENAEKICDNYILSSGLWKGQTGSLYKLPCNSIPVLCLSSCHIGRIFCVFFYSVDTWIIEWISIGDELSPERLWIDNITLHTINTEKIINNLLFRCK